MELEWLETPAVILGYLFKPRKNSGGKIMVAARSSSSNADRPGEPTTSSPASPWMNPALFSLGFSVVLSLVVIFGLASYRDTFSVSAASWFAGIAGSGSNHRPWGGPHVGITSGAPEHGAVPTSSAFKLASSDPLFVDGGVLPDAYTCNAADGVGVSPPLTWENAPKETQQFMILMQTDAYHENTYLYTRDDWTIYGISSSVSSIAAANAGGVGIKGGTYPGVSMHIYNAPCPFGSGYYTYNFMLIALNADMATSVYAEYTAGDSTADIGITMAEKAKANGMIAATTQMTVTFCRTGCTTADAEAFAARNKQSHFFGDVTAASSSEQQQPSGKADGSVADVSTDLVVTEGGNMKIDNAGTAAAAASAAATTADTATGEGDANGLAPFHKLDEPMFPTVVDVPFTQAAKDDTSAPKAGGNTGDKEIPAIAALVPKTTSPKGSGSKGKLRRGA
jgi:hypothetical protein